MIEFKTYQDNDIINIDAAWQLLPAIEQDTMAGWYHPGLDDRTLSNIQQAASQIHKQAEYLVCIGIGGSYLGHRAVIEALGNSSHTKVLYAGHNLSSQAIQQVIDQIGNKDFAINIISKSGTTLEPALAFRIFKQKLIDKYGEMEAYTRIYATTDANKGALHDESTKNGYTTFVVPDDIGGRYSVLTPVGLLPLAVAGIDIKKLLYGAKAQSESVEDILTYATARQALYARGYDTEVLATFEPSLGQFNEWWKQLFGESEGKGGGGLFPASVIFSTDLHSLGQFLQDGRTNLFETFLNFTEPAVPELTIPTSYDNLDGLNYLAGESLDYVNHQALLATIKAHSQHHPVFELTIPALNTQTVGAMIYFFELACAVSAKIQGVNPFDQPGVEAYKKEMFKLLEGNK